MTPDVKPPEGGMDGVPVPEGGTQDGGGLYSTPWALSEKCFLASYTYSNKETDAKGYGLYLVDVFGNKELDLSRPGHFLLHADAAAGAAPAAGVSRIGGPVQETTPPACISDVSFGSEEIAGRIRYVRIAEPIGWPYDNQLGGQRYGEKGPHLINWTPIRILGDVPVETRRQRALRSARRHRRLFPVAGREPHGAAAHAELHQLPARRERAPAPAATRRAV